MGAQPATATAPTGKRRSSKRPPGKNAESSRQRSNRNGSAETAPRPADPTGGPILTELAHLSDLALDEVSGSRRRDMMFDAEVPLGEVGLTGIEWNQGDGQPTGHIAGRFDRPFLAGRTRMPIDGDGRPSGEVEVEAHVALGGHTIASIVAATNEWDGGPVPLPEATLDGHHLTVSLGTELTGTIQPADAAVAAMVAVGAASAVADLAAMDGLPTGIKTLLGTPSLDVEQLGQVRTIAPAIAEAIEMITGIALNELRVVTDVDNEAFHQQTGLDISEISAESAPMIFGSHLLFGPGAYQPDTEVGIQALARAVVAAARNSSDQVADERANPASDDVEEAEPLDPEIPLPSPTPTEAAPGPTPTPTDETEVSGPGGAGGDDGAGPTTEGVDSDIPTGQGTEVTEGAEAGEGPEVELLMPPAPAAPTPEQEEGIATVGGNARSATGSARRLPSASDSTVDAQAAVTIPDSETLGRARQALVTKLGGQPEPSPEIVELCRNMGEAIRAHRPVDEDELLDADLREPAQQAGSSLNASVEAEGDAVAQNYQQVDEPPELTAPRTPSPLEAPASTIGEPDLQAEAAAPREIPPEDLSLGNDRQALDRRVEESEIHRPTTEVIPDGPFAEARAGQAELAGLEEAGPAEVAAEQQQAITQSREQMQQLQLQTLEALNSSRSSTVSSNTNRQGSMVETEAQTRERLSDEANGIFNEARSQVTNLLNPLTRVAMTMWAADVDRLTTEFRTSLDEVKSWVDERHSGIGGSILGAWDSLTGLPSWVGRAYDRAEQAFTDGVCESLTRISIEVNTVISAVEGIIATAEAEIRVLYTENLPAGLESWAAEQLAGFETKLNGLRSQVEQTRTDFVGEISREAISAVQAVQAEVEQLREEAKGIIGRVVDAINEFIDDPITAIINGLLRLVGIPPASFWALIEKIRQAIEDIANDPMNFINNLTSAVGQGFQLFFDHFDEHLLKGLWDWFFSGLGPQGIAMPEDFSIGGIVSFALELMGITWPNIREILVRHIGEENVELIEQAWELVKTLIELGPAGILEMIKERLDPATIFQQILDAAIEYLTTTLIAVVAEKVLMLLTPVGAIAQAIMLIYDVLVWIFNNAARIFRFIETIVNGIADIIAGNITAMAQAVEAALASLIPVVIDFLAQLLRLGGLPEAVADVIKGLRDMVLGAIDAVVGFLVGQARRLLEALGFGDEDDDADDDESGSEDTTLGTEVTFSAHGESHRQWVDLNGDDAELMIASTPSPVVAKLDHWAVEKDKLADDQKEQATTLLSRARQLTEQGNTQGDAVAEEFTEAAADPEIDPPSDAPLESTQQQLGPVLDDLFTLFGEKKDLLLMFGQELDRMHPAGKTDALTDVAGLSEEDVASTRTWNDLRLHLEGAPRISKAVNRPTHKDGGTFQQAAEAVVLEVVSGLSTELGYAEGRAETWLRGRKANIVPGKDGPYAKIVGALSDMLWTGSNPRSDLETALKELGGDGPDGELVEALGSTDIVAFMDTLSKGGTVGSVNQRRFTELWEKQANKDYVKDRFRAAHPGQHEWIPSDLIAEVIARTGSVRDALEYDDWVQMHHRMRTDTTWIIFSPGFQKGRAQINGRDQEALAGHSGAVYYPRDGRRIPLTTGQGPWHDQLRSAFRKLESGPPEVIAEMKDIADETVWSGSTSTATASIYQGPYYQARSSSTYALSALATAQSTETTTNDSGRSARIQIPGGPPAVGNTEHEGRKAALLAQFEQWANELSR